MNKLENKINTTNQTDLKDVVSHNHLDGNAALDRLKTKLTEEHGHAGEAIKSYDRMHHRHNRA